MKFLPDEIEYILQQGAVVSSCYLAGIPARVIMHMGIRPIPLKILYQEKFRWWRYYRKITGRH